jgi:hypothetical protein
MTLKDFDLEREAKKFLTYYDSLFQQMKKKGKKADLDDDDSFSLQGEFHKWGQKYKRYESSEYRRAVWLKVLELAPIKNKANEKIIEQLKKRAEVVKKGEEHKWAESKNIGKSKRVPKYWTLCGIGPDDWFVELTPEVVSFLARWPDDEKEIERLSEEELERIENENFIDYFKGVCALIDPINRKEIITNPELYSGFLIRALYLFIFYTKGEEVLTIIKKAHEKLGNTLKEICTKREGYDERPVWDEETGREYSVEVSLFEKKMGEGWEALLNTVRRIEKDFLGKKGGVQQPDHYLTKVYQNRIKKGLPPEEEMPMDLISVPKGYGEDETVSILFDEIHAKREREGFCYPYYQQFAEMVKNEKRKERRSFKTDPSSLDLSRLKRPKRKRQILELYQGGVTYKDIAERLGVSKKTVQRDLKEMNII